MRADSFFVAIAIPFARVLNRFEFEQAEIFALFKVFVVFFSDVDRRPIRDHVRALEQTSRFRAAWLSVGSQALGFRVILILIHEHVEILDDRSATVVFIREFVHRGLWIVNIDALSAHPFIAVR